MATTFVGARLDEDLLRRLDQLCQELSRMAGGATITRTNVLKTILRKLPAKGVPTWLRAGQP